MEASAAERCTGILADYAERLLIVRGVKYPARPQRLRSRAGPRSVFDRARARPARAQQRHLHRALRGHGDGGGPQPGGYRAVDALLGDEGRLHRREALVQRGRSRCAPRRATRTTCTSGSPGCSIPAPVNPRAWAIKLALRRKSVNDLHPRELSSLMARPELSKADKERLDLHFTTIRDVENTMTDMTLVLHGGRHLDMAAIEAMNSGQAFRQNGQIEEVAKLQMELVALAFACNATRVATLQVGDGTDGNRYTIDGEVVERFHWISHRIQSDGTSGRAIPKALEWHTAIDRIRMNTFKHLLDKWSEYQTPDGEPARQRLRALDQPRRGGPVPQLQQPAVHHRRQRRRLAQAGPVRRRGQRDATRGLLNTLLSACGVPVENFGAGVSDLISQIVA